MVDLAETGQAPRRSARSVAPPPDPAAPDGPGRPRLVVVDALRGLAVALMLLVNNSIDKAATPVQLRHAEWSGFTLADLVFPLFLFAVGLSLPLSRRAGQWRPVLRRVALLTVVGMLLVSAKSRHLAPATGVLQHIAAAYALAWGVLRLPRRHQLAAGLGLLVAVALVNELLAPGGPAADAYARGSTLGERLDELLIGGFSAEGPHTYLPSALTVLAGVAAGRLLLALPRREAARCIGALGVVTLGAGLLLAPVVPVNKSLWTASYLLVTAGLSCLLLAAGHLLLDRRTGRRLAAPLVVLGANALVAYAGSYLVFSALLRYEGQRGVDVMQALLGPTGGTLAYATTSVLLIWALTAVLHRRGVLVRL